MGSDRHQEITDAENIKKYFNTTNDLQTFISKNLVEVINVKTHRREYVHGEITVEVDEMDFGYKCVEIEKVVADEKDVPKALTEIMVLAKLYGFENKKASPKRKEYFRVKKPELYKQFYE